MKEKEKKSSRFFSRKFLLALISILIAVIFLSIGVISESTFLWIITSALGIYSGGNIGAKLMTRDKGR